MIPSKRSELCEWIRQEMGEPVIDALPLAAQQLDNCIDNAIEYYQLFAGAVGNEENYAVINTGTMATSAVSLCALEGTPFSVCDPTVTVPLMQHKAEFQLPKSVIALGETLPGGAGSLGGLSWLTTAPNQDIIERGLNGAESLSNTAFGNFNTGGPINSSVNNYIGMFFPGTFYGGGAYGTRGGVRADGGGMDIVTYELGMQYMEMLNKQYKVTVHMEFHAASRKVRIQPPPKGAGIYIVRVWTKVVPEHLYDDLFVRQYSLALSMMQVGRTLQVYKGVKFMGGIEINGDFFYTEGKALKEKLEEEVSNSKWGFPPTAFMLG